VISIKHKFSREDIPKETTYKLEMIIKHNGNLQIMPESGECSLAISQEAENYWDVPKSDKKRFAVTTNKNGMVVCSVELDNHKLCIGDVNKTSGWWMKVSSSLIDLQNQFKYKNFSETHYVERHKVSCYDF